MFLSSRSEVINNFEYSLNTQTQTTRPTLTHRLWGCVGEVVGSPRADRCVLRVCDDKIGEPPLLVSLSGLASNYFRIRALLSTPDFGLRADSTALARARLERSGTHKRVTFEFLFLFTV